MSVLPKIMQARQRVMRGPQSRGADISLLCIGNGLEAYAQCATKLAPFLSPGVEVDDCEDDICEDPYPYVRLPPETCADTILRASARHSIAVFEYGGKRGNFYCMLFIPKTSTTQQETADSGDELWG